MLNSFISILQNSKGVQLFIYLITPKSKDEDRRRREFIFNIIIIGSIILTLVANVVFLADSIRLKEKPQGVSFGIIFFLLIFQIFLFWLSRVERFYLASYIFIAFLFICATYIIFKWGFDIPQALLVYALVIVIGGILISTRFALVITFIISTTILSIAYLQINSLIPIDLYWATETLKISDAVVYVFTLLVIMLVSWLSNREIERSLKRARRSEAALKKEKDLLEVKVEERTQELKKAQMEKLKQIYQCAEFGRLSKGLFHDLTNYLLALTLNLEETGLSEKKKNKHVRPYIKNVFKTTRRLENFIMAVQKQFKTQDVNLEFSLENEVKQAIQLLNYKAKKQGVALKLIVKDKVNTFGNPIKFNHVITNTISNAIDAYDDALKKTPKQVLIKIFKDKGLAFIIIKDRGVGIPKGFIDKIFDPFFTSKDYKKGSGIGLAASKEIIENDFHGIIQVKSKENKGTAFKIKFPIKTDENAKNT